MVAEALNVIAGGGTWFSGKFFAARVTRQNDPKHFSRVLSHHEQSLLGLFGLGKTDREIAVQIGLAARTVEGHRSNLLKKLGLEGTPRLMAFAVEKGFVPSPLYHGG